MSTNEVWFELATLRLDTPHDCSNMHTHGHMNRQTETHAHTCTHTHTHLPHTHIVATAMATLSPTRTCDPYTRSSLYTSATPHAHTKQITLIRSHAKEHNALRLSEEECTDVYITRVYVDHWTVSPLQLVRTYLCDYAVVCVCVHTLAGKCTIHRASAIQ